MYTLFLKVRSNTILNYQQLTDPLNYVMHKIYVSSILSFEFLVIGFIVSHTYDVYIYDMIRDTNIYVCIMTGVQTAVTEFSTGKVVVTGTMDENKLVDYVYRRTKKQARIVPQPVPEPEKKEENKEGEKLAAEEAKPEEKKEEEKPPEEAKKEEGDKGGNNNGESNENKGGGGGGDENKEVAKKEGEEIVVINNNIDEEGMKRMVYYYQPVYVIERIPPPPQLFSDENPNACCIS